MKLTTLLIVSLSLFVGCHSPSSNNKPEKITTFSFSNEVVVLGTPEAVFDTLTGNIKPWWDHTFSNKPDRLFIQPYPGGGFYEYFDKHKNGVRHALVTAADRGKLLRLEGPLGLAGHAISLVSTVKLDTQTPDSTKITIQVHASGEIQQDWPQVVEQVWKHFIEDRLKPYLEGNLSN